MEVSVQLNIPAALYMVPNGQETGWAPKPVWMRLWREENPSPSRESNPGRPDRSLVTIVAEILNPSPSHFTTDDQSVRLGVQTLWDSRP